MRITYCLIACSMLLSACADLSAVTTFSATAPDVTKLDTLTDIYVSDPETQARWESINTTPDPNWVAESAARSNQKASLDKIHSLLINYMKSLGTIAAAKTTDVSTQAKAVSTNLAAMQKAGQVNITAAQAAAIGDLITIAPRDALSVWRSHEVGKIIRENKDAFHAIVASEIDIVGKIYKRDYTTVRGAIDSSRGRMDGNLSPHLSSQNEKATLFLFDESASQYSLRLKNAESAADSYVKALNNLLKAYDKLVDDSNKINKSTLRAILPYIIDANGAYQDMNKI